MASNEITYQIQEAQATKRELANLADTFEENCRRNGGEIQADIASRAASSIIAALRVGARICDEKVGYLQSVPNVQPQNPQSPVTRIEEAATDFDFFRQNAHSGGQQQEVESFREQHNRKFVSDRQFREGAQENDQPIREGGESKASSPAPSEKNQTSGWRAPSEVGNPPVEIDEQALDAPLRMPQSQPQQRK